MTPALRKLRRLNPSQWRTRGPRKFSMARFYSRLHILANRRSIADFTIIAAPTGSVPVLGSVFPIAPHLSMISA